MRHDASADDEALGRKLSRGGSRLDPAGLRALLAGVAAAPQGEDPDSWMTLVATAPDEGLKAELRSLKARMQEEGPGAAARRKPEAAARLAVLRQELARRGLEGFIVPRADEHQGEYVPPRAERLAWLTGFTGSAGVAVVLQAKAAIFVDGRYTLQSAQQVDSALFEQRHLTDEPPDSWIAANLPAGARLGYDPWLHTPDGVTRLRGACERAGGALADCADNPLDAVWTDQPPQPLAPVIPYDIRFAGKPAAEKRHEIAAALAKQGVDSVVLTAPDSIAWLLNIRGADVPHTPLPLSFAILHQDATVDLFIDARKLVPGIEAHLGNSVAVRSPDNLGPSLDALGREGRKVLADPTSAAAWVFDRLAAAGSKPVRGDDPCQLPKACKNPVEIAGTAEAHRRDGAAVTRFLAWLSTAAPTGTLREIEASDRLHALRRENELFRDLSFSTISGSGPNGAIVHYRATPESNRALRPGELYLIDSGAQYLDGTTDITRTVAIGEPTAEMREHFTRVLKGHIALGTARFPRGTTGSQLDTLARAALWQAGLDYDHGTGHGVGSYLGVHEGPQRISKIPNRVPLEIGMIVSNEPGYYRTGAYGIRIENLVTVVALDAPGADRPMLGFETLTLAPIDRNLVERSLLNPAEIAWLDAYHARVRETLTPRVDAATAAWLAAATKPIG